MAKTMASATALPPPISTGAEPAQLARIDPDFQVRVMRMKQRLDRVMPTMHRPMTGFRPQRSASDPYNSATKMPIEEKITPVCIVIERAICFWVEQPRTHRG